MYKKRNNKMDKLFFYPDAGVEVQVVNYFCKQGQEFHVFMKEGIVCGWFKRLQLREFLIH